MRSPRWNDRRVDSMSRSRWLMAVAALALVAAGGVFYAVTASSALTASSAVSAGSAVFASSSHRAAVPAHVFAPYFEAYTTDSPAALSQASGARYLNFAFIQTPAAGSCTIDWNGNPATPIASSVYGTDIADSCTNVALIAAAYEKVITTYNVTRLDPDTEDNSLTNPAGVDRRNKAIRMVEDWAARHDRAVQFVYTLPTNVAGLNATGLYVLQNAVTNQARIDIVNIMTFDYYDNQPHEMAADSMTAAQHLYDSLHQLYPARSAHRLWSMIGVTEMLGIDDFGPPEIFTTADATTIEHWAVTKHLAELSFWALERDNGGCPGTKGSDSCSGISQATWQFSHTFEPFTSR